MALVTRNVRMGLIRWETGQPCRFRNDFRFDTGSRGVRGKGLADHTDENNSPEHPRMVAIGSGQGRHYN
jgi:hypothetical protein